VLANKPRPWRIRDTANRFSYTLKEARAIEGLLPASLCTTCKRGIVERLQKAAEFGLLTEEGLFHDEYLSKRAHDELSAVLEALDSIVPILERRVLSGDETLSVLETLAIHEGATPQEAIIKFRRFRDGLAQRLETKPKHGWNARAAARKSFGRHVVLAFEDAFGQRPTLVNRDNASYSQYERFVEAVAPPTGLIRPGASVRRFARDALKLRQ
jgi:hypothetical protein